MIVDSALEKGRESTARWTNFLSNIRSAVERNAMLLVATSRYYGEYLRYFTGHGATIVGLDLQAPAGVQFHFDPTGEVWVVCRAMLYGSHDVFTSAIVQSIGTGTNLTVRRVLTTELGSGGSARAVVWFPWEVQHEYLQPIYSAGIPLMLPSLDYLVYLERTFSVLLDRHHWESAPRPQLLESEPGDDLANPKGCISLKPQTLDQLSPCKL